MDDKKVIRCSQHGFNKGKSCLTNLTAFCNETNTGMNEGKTVDVVCPDFSKDFNTVSHNTLIDKLKECGLNEWTLRSWLNGRSVQPVSE